MASKSLRSAVALLVPLLGVSGAWPSAPAGASPWTPAPLYGADVRSLTFDPRDPDRALAGTSAGHVYRSDDGGESWREAGPSAPFPGWVVGSLVFDPERPERLWAGLWGIWGGGSVAFSDDFSESWTERREGLSAGDQVYALAAIPGSPGRLLAATRTGVWATTDEGRSWVRASSSAPELIHVSSLLVDPFDARRILAGTWRRAFRSADGGATWSAAPEGMLLDSEVFSLQPVPGRPGELWASTCGWVYRGQGFGERWTRVTTGFAERRTPSLLVIDAGRVLAGTVAGLHLSTDGGESFRRTTDPRLPILALAHHPRRPERILIGTEGAGVWLSRDGGETASPRLVATVNVRVPALVANGDTVFAAVAHAGPLSGVYSSPDHGHSFGPRPAELPTVLDLAATPERILAATERGLWERSNGEWRRVAELGSTRIEQVLVAGDRVVVRSTVALFELVGDRFRKLEVEPDEASSVVALAWGDLWLGSGAGLVRVAPDGARTLSWLPEGSTALVPAGGSALLASGPDGLHLRTERDGAWRRLTAGPTRALATGDARFPLLLVRPERLELFDAGKGKLIALALDLPEETVTSALVAGERLLVGTSGFGLWQGALPEAPVSERVELEAQGSPSEARMRR